MGFEDILGQDAALQVLRRALGSGRHHHAYRFEGPPGVGKELAAFAYAQALVCERAGAEACGACRACHRAVTLSSEPPHVPLHPDVVLVERALYAPSLLGTTGGEATGIGIAQVRRVVLERAGFPPHEGRALVFIVRDADQLTVSAANALLKTLEEPPPCVHFVLLTSRPNHLLDTIRSRTLPVRFAPLSDELVARMLRARALSEDAAPLAQGSMATALALADDVESARRRDFVAALERSLAARELGSALLDAAKLERDGLRSLLFYYAQTLSLEARARVTDDLEMATVLARRYVVVLRAMDDLAHNTQPQLALDAMVQRLRAA